MKEQNDFRRKVYLFFFRHANGKKQGAYYFFLLLLSTSAALLAPQIYSMFVDRILIGRDVSHLSVVKVWKDTGHEKQRPSEVVVTLYGDEVEYSTVTLNAQNNWKYIWRGLDDNVSWKLVERDIPSNYHVTAVRETTTFVVTNTFIESPPGPNPGPTPGESMNPPPSRPTLPQTGQLWWPLPYLFISGLVMLLIGIKLKVRGTVDHV